MSKELTSEAKLKAMTDSQIIQRLAVFMGWKKMKLGWDCGEGKVEIGWNPLTNWNHWREIEERVMKDEGYHREFLLKFWNPEEAWGREYMKADLPTRCRALISVLDND